MRFEKHAFISYGHVDNIATSDEEHAWVTRFHEDLRAYLSTNLGRDAEIWRDDRLRGNSMFEQEIMKQFPLTATLVSVLSKRYMESGWCKKELDAFCDAAGGNGGLIVQNKARVLYVMLKPIALAIRNQLPGMPSGGSVYQFYQEVEGARTLPLDPKFGNSEAYHRNVYFLAEDLSELVQQLEESPGSGRASVQPGRDPKPVVYLAECSYDRADERQRLRDELRANGYTVWPEQGAQLPELDADYVAEVTRLLRLCDLSIHVVGSFPGKIPDGSSGKSAVRLQNEVAAKLTSEKRLERIIWMPPAPEGPPPTSNFLDLLTRDPELQKGADLIVGDFESLKSAVRVALSKLAAPPSPSAALARAPCSLYLICAEEDLEALSPLTNY